MTDVTKGATPRREFLKNTGRLAAASALAGVIVPHVHAAEDNTIRLALIGTGGRGSGAVGDALSSPNGPAKLYAMADLFANRLEGSHKALSNECGDKIDVPKERQFLGFDAYRKAIDCLRPCDVALLTTYSGFVPHTWSTPWKRASTSSWRSVLRAIPAACSEFSVRARRPKRRTSKSPPD